MTAAFVYDGDGNRVKATINGVATYFVGNIYEKTGESETKYYYAGGQRIAMRVSDTLYYLLTDHLGSTTVTTNENGAKVAEVQYAPWGEVRYTSGSTPTDYTFTGQYSNVDDFGLMYYNARWYDPALGRFASWASARIFDRQTRSSPRARKVMTGMRMWGTTRSITQIRAGIKRARIPMKMDNVS